MNEARLACGLWRVASSVGIPSFCYLFIGRYFIIGSITVKSIRPHFVWKGGGEEGTSSHSLATSDKHSDSCDEHPAAAFADRVTLMGQPFG